MLNMVQNDRSTWVGTGEEQWSSFTIVNFAAGGAGRNRPGRLHPKKSNILFKWPTHRDWIGTWPDGWTRRVTSYWICAFP